MKTLLALPAYSVMEGGEIYEDFTELHSNDRLGNGSYESTECAC